MNARTQTIVAALLLGLALVALVGGIASTVNTPAMAGAPATAFLTVVASLFALGLGALEWVAALLLLKGQGAATLSARWLVPGALGVCLPISAHWTALLALSASLPDWGILVELLGLAPLAGGLTGPLLGLLALGVLAVDAEVAERPAVDPSLPAHWSAAPLTAEDIAREMAEAAETTEAEAEVIAEEAPSDDLTQIRGIGPKTAAALAGGGVRTLAQLATAGRQEIERILREASVRGGDVDGWREQAALAARGEQKARPPNDDAPQS